MLVLFDLDFGLLALELALLVEADLVQILEGPLVDEVQVLEPEELLRVVYLLLRLR